MKVAIRKFWSKLDPARDMLFYRALPLERETALFILANALDLFMTYILLRHQWTQEEHGGTHFYESNPLAAAFFNTWDVSGLVLYKFVLVAVVAVVVQVIALSKPTTARRVLNFATATASGVVMYSVALFLRNGGIL